MPTFLRLVQRDDRLLLTLCDENGNEIDSDTAPSGEAAIRSAIMLLHEQRHCGRPIGSRRIRIEAFARELAA